MFLKNKISKYFYRDYSEFINNAIVELQRKGFENFEKLHI